jgi:hypothetical protein
MLQIGSNIEHSHRSMAETGASYSLTRCTTLSVLSTCANPSLFARQSMPRHDAFCLETLERWDIATRPHGKPVLPLGTSFANQRRSYALLRPHPSQQGRNPSLQNSTLFAIHCRTHSELYLQSSCTNFVCTLPLVSSSSDCSMHSSYAFLTLYHRAMEFYVPPYPARRCPLLSVIPYLPLLA